MNSLFLFGVVFLCAFFLERDWIERSNCWNMTQVQKEYGPQNHIETKSKTPSMGGVMFIFASLITLIVIVVMGWAAFWDVFIIWLLPWGAALIGFADDWIKFKSRSSEGFPSLVKLVIQIIIVVPWAILMSWKQGVSLCPGVLLPWWFAVPFLAILTIGMLNAVNVTDGLDGLAIGATIISLVMFLTWFPGNSAVRGCALGTLSMSLAFLWYNAYPAAVFMGDVGSHFLAGMLVSLCVFSDFIIAVIPLGFLFGIEILSVSIQLVAIHKFKRKVFKMSPLHHHFELSGWSEIQIVTRFWLIHGLGAWALIYIFLQW